MQFLLGRLEGEGEGSCRGSRIVHVPGGTGDPGGCVEHPLHHEGLATQLVLRPPGTRNDTHVHHARAHVSPRTRARNPVHTKQVQGRAGRDRKQPTQCRGGGRLKHSLRLVNVRDGDVGELRHIMLPHDWARLARAMEPQLLRRGTLRFQEPAVPTHRRVAAHTRARTHTHSHTQTRQSAYCTLCTHDGPPSHDG